MFIEITSKLTRNRIFFNNGFLQKLFKALFRYSAFAAILFTAAASGLLL
jgi:hypothetical protein